MLVVEECLNTSNPNPEACSPPATSAGLEHILCVEIGAPAAENERIAHSPHFPAADAYDHWSTRYQLTVPSRVLPPWDAGDEAGKQGSERLRTRVVEPWGHRVLSRGISSTPF